MKKAKTLPTNVEVEAYTKGKGTLWFALDEPLPRVLIEKTEKRLFNRSD